jgi:hypothetical protein
MVGSAVFLLSLAALPGQASPGAPELPAVAGLTGRWTFNEKESDDARAKMREARERAGGGRRPGGPAGGFGGGFGRPGGFGGRGGGGRGGPAGGVRPEGGAPGDALRDLLEPGRTLVITGNEAELTLDDGSGALVRLHLDGRAYKTEGGDVRTTARFKDGALVVERTSERGAKATTTYLVRGEAKKLDITTRLSGGMMGELSLRRVYDAAPEP